MLSNPAPGGTCNTVSLPVEGWTILLFSCKPTSVRIQMRDSRRQDEHTQLLCTSPATRWWKRGFANSPPILYWTYWIYQSLSDFTALPGFFFLLDCSYQSQHYVLERFSSLWFNVFIYWLSSRWKMKNGIHGVRLFWCISTWWLQSASCHTLFTLRVALPWVLMSSSVYFCLFQGWDLVYCSNFAANHKKQWIFICF